MHFADLVFIFYNLYDNIKLLRNGVKCYLKFIIDKSDKYTETEIIIKCSSIDERVKKIIDIIEKSESDDTFLTVQAEEITRKIKFKDVFYFESVDERTFVYTQDNVYRCKEKLYELEKILKESPFVRISKSCILNTDCLESIRASFNGKLEALLINGEKVIINRHYVPDFKRKFGL